MNDVRLGDSATLQVDAVTLIDDLNAIATADDLPAMPELLKRLRARLVEGGYNILVVGEAKRGKSTFINALLGEAILPTDVEVATNQAILVRNSTGRCCVLRLIDGSSIEIPLDELRKYGSQAHADASGAPQTASPIDLIEVELPASFLPEGVQLIDTPGMGALYAAHAQITRRFVPLADAVIMVLDASSPVNQAEIDLVAELLNQTDRLLFIMTKIDQHGRDAWEQTKSRTESILRERFGQNLSDIVVWPISSANLLDSMSDTHGDALMLVSRYPDLIRAINQFLSAVVAKPRALEALVVAAHYHASLTEIVGHRVDALDDAEESSIVQRKNQLERQWKTLQSEWGSAGAKKLQLETDIRRVTQLAKQAFREALSTNGRLDRLITDKIEGVNTLAEANALGESLGELIVTQAVDEWGRVCSQASAQYAALLGPLEVNIELETANVDDPSVRAREYKAIEASGYDLFRGAYGQAMPLMAVSGVVVGLIASPVLLVAAAGGAIWACARGWHRTSEQALKGAQAELKRCARDVEFDVMHHFFSADQERGQFSRVDEYYTSVEKGVAEHVLKSIEARMATLRSEYALMTRQETKAADDRAAQRGHFISTQEQLKGAGDQIRRLFDLYGSIQSAPSS